MGDIFNKVKKAGAYAADKTGDMVEMGVAKGKIASRKGDIADVEKVIGKYVYKKYLKEKSEDDEVLLEHFRRIDELNYEIAELEAQIFATKNED